MQHATRTTSTMLSRLFMLGALVVATTACFENTYPSGAVRITQATPIPLEVPPDLSVFRGNLQRTGVFSNGGTPPLERELWRSQQGYSIEHLALAGDALVFSLYNEQRGLQSLDAQT